MKSYRKELWFETEARRVYLNITSQVEECLRESGVREGLVLCNAMHITASVFINDDESGLHHDYEVWLEKLAPEKPYSQYKHNGYEDNADAHLKRTVMGREIVAAITDAKLDFGTWELDRIQVSQIGVTLLGIGKYDEENNPQIQVNMTDGTIQKMELSTSFSQNKKVNLKYLSNAPLDSTMIESVNVDGKLINFKH